MWGEKSSFEKSNVMTNILLQSECVSIQIKMWEVNNLFETDTVGEQVEAHDSQISSLAVSRSDKMLAATMTVMTDRVAWDDFSTHFAPFPL